MGKTILVIEDDEVLGGAIIKKLQNAGYNAELYDDGKKGYDRLISGKPDALLLDILIPSMNGYEILEKKQKEASIADVPVIVISNSGQPVEISRVKELGVEDYLIKANFSPEEVLDKVKAVLGDSPNDKTMAESRGKKVVLVEDEAFLRDLLSMKLTKEGYELVHAVDGKEAIDAVRENMPDLVLLDLVLPSMSGFDVLATLKKDPKTKAIPVVILSNLGQETDIKRGKELGALDFLVKANYSIDEVIEHIQKFLKK